jgi:predicted nucleic acid-binding protein
VKAFFDTNILVYTATSDARKPQAVDCLGRGGVVSVQVLNEFVHVARRKFVMTGRRSKSRSGCSVRRSMTSCPSR